MSSCAILDNALFQTLFEQISLLAKLLELYQVGSLVTKRLNISMFSQQRMLKNDRFAYCLS